MNSRIRLDVTNCLRSSRLRNGQDMTNIVGESSKKIRELDVYADKGKSI